MTHRRSDGSTVEDQRQANGDGKYLLRWLLGLFASIIVILLTINAAWMSRVDSKMSSIGEDFSAMKQIVSDHTRRIGNLEDDWRRGGHTP